MRILLLLTAIAAVSQAQTDCSRGACYPPSNDLLLGRAQQLHASSTCGLTGAEVYCTPYQQRRMKCCPCDSRNPTSQLAHTMRDALSTSGPDRWWQSVKELNPVTLQLDLDNLFQLDNLVLSFKGPRPSAFVIERTLDNGRSWQPALYLATDCQRTFPRVPTTTPLTLDDTYCYTLPPTGADAYQDHKIEFSPLRQYAYVPASKSQKIEDASGLTGLRVRFTELGDVPRPPGRALSRFYALREMRVMGSCMCHGHANRCLPDTNNNLPSDRIQVHPQCDCQHNTAGVNCERCADLFVDLPWRPAEEGNTHTCKRCECNNHAQSCSFDQAVYEASGGRSGGVCEGCMHHTTGPKCDECAPGYQPNPRSQMDRPDACIRCECNNHAQSCSFDQAVYEASGRRSGGVCEGCMHHTTGPKCDECAPGYQPNPRSQMDRPDACIRCECNNHAQSCSFDQAVYEASGRRSGGVCEGCMHHTTGPKCDECAPGYQPNPRSQMDRPDACIRCVCSTEGTVNGGQCDDSTGSCLCKVNVEGPRCDRCKRGYYDLSPSNPLGCSSCECNNHAQSCSFDQAVYEASGRRSGAVCEGCMHHTTGPKCDECAPGYQPNPRSQMDRPDACIRCVCSTEGTVNGGRCDDSTGSCLCKVNVEGPRCDRCKRGYYDLSPSNPLGCSSCECNNHAQSCSFDQAVYEASGRRSGAVCEGCMHHTTGPKCDECAPGYQPNPRSQMDRPDACIRCVCSTEGTVNGGRCDDSTGSCLCKVNVEGPRCDRCKRGYYDLSPSNPLGCSSCECNNHAQSCSFDQAVYEASGRRSGAVCEGCMHHTTGPKCDECAPGYQPNPRSQMDRPDACIRCVCSTEGTVNGGRCDDSTGSCLCKVNVEGPRCDRCKRGYYDLSPSNPLGCSKCSCSPDGSLSNICDPITGKCPCRSHFHGMNCEVCSQGYWKPSLSGRCQPCGCDSTRSYSDTCDQVTGQCQCRPGFGGLTCTECPEKAYGDPLIGCRSCRCDAEGTLPEVCDKQTGACLCRPGVTGARCDSCKRGHCDSFPGCETCPSCFFTLDAQRQNLSIALERLSLRLPSRPVGDGDLGNFGPRIRLLEASLTLIQNSISLPPSVATQIDDALSQLDKLRDQTDKINDDLSPLEKAPGLDSELDRLQALLDRLTLDYKAKKDAKDNSVSQNNSGSIAAIKDAYDESTDAAKKVDASGKPLKESADIRKDTMDLQNEVQPGNTRDLDKLNNSMASRPNLTPVAKQVCGSVRSEPCTPLQCAGGDLCPPDGTPPCKKGEVCVGALPLSKRADADAKDVKDELDKLTGKITDAVEKLQETQDTTNQVRQSTEKLSNKMKQARDELEDDLKETRDVLKELKDFLSDPSSNLTHIQEVSDWILKAKLPLSLAALKRKLEELKNLASSLPDSTSVLKEAEPQLDTARKMLEEAQDARDTALGVKADVDGLLEGFNSVEGSLSDLKDKLQDSMDLIDNLNSNLTEAKDQLSPAEKALDDVSKLIKPMKPQLDELKDVLQDGDLLAQDAQNDADNAEEEAAGANEDLSSLEKELDRLKDAAPTSAPGGAEGPLGDRVAKLQKDAGALANTTDNMVKALEGKADSLRGLQDEIIQKSSNLKELDADLRELLKTLRKKATDLSTCQG